MGRSFVSKLAFPGVDGHSEVEEGIVRIDTPNLSVPAFFFEHEGARANLIYCHGNAMVIQHMRKLAKFYSNELGINVLVPEIPGRQYDWGRTAFKSGDESQLASEKSYCEAVEGAFDWFQKSSHSAIPTVVFGQSLGSGAAMELCMRRPCSGLVLQSPLLSAVKVASISMPVLPGTDLFVNIHKAPKLTIPTTIMHGERDRVISIEHGRKLASLIPAEHLVELFELPEAGHNDMEAVDLQGILTCVNRLIDEVLLSKDLK